ncbi:MAG: SynChlorMet cassette protein ScmD [Syntrophorhabdales bacterium]
MLREEFDDWAVLFNPDTGHGFGLSPTGVYVWKLLDGEHTHDAIVQKIREHENVPEAASDHIKAFVDALLAEGLAGFDRTRFGLPNTADRRNNSSSSPPAAVSEVQPITYEPPRLVNLNGSLAYGDDCNDGSHAANSCHNGPFPCICNYGPADDYSGCRGGNATACTGCCSWGIQSNACSGGTWPVSACNGGSYTGQCCTTGPSGS